MKKYLMLLMGMLYLYPLLSKAQIVVPKKDSLPFIELPTFTVTSRRITWTQREHPMAREETARALQHIGVSFIQRGSVLGQDVYLNGFKRGEVEILIDGERYPNSCPNRMDPPLLRVNPLEMESVEVETSTAHLQAELGGAVVFHRRSPTQKPQLRSALSQTLGASTSTDLAFSMDGWHHRLTGRLFLGRSYRDGAGKSFGERYGYRKADISYRFVEASIEGKQQGFRYGFQFSSATDIPYPYLLMDERQNTLTGGFLRYREHRLYANYTHHLMDNRLRQSTMAMETDARNLIVGLTDNRHYEIFFRFWNAQNTMQMGKMVMQQPMIPEVSIWSLQVFHRLSWQSLEIQGKLGIRRYGIGDASRLNLYRSLYPEAPSERWFPVFSLSAGHTWYGQSLAVGITGEIGSTPPVPEYLYVALKRPAGKPWRVGNPMLKPPLRTALHVGIQHPHFRVTASSSLISNYVNLTAVSTETVKATTYTNVRALLASLEMQATYRFLSGSVQYTYGQNLTDSRPLAEMMPLTLNLRLTSSNKHPLRGYLSGTYAMRQTRVDASLGEEQTPSYYRLDAGLSYRIKRVTLALDVENVTNQVYYTHLSYLRDPFRSGLRVYEPGRTFHLRLRWQP